MSEIATETAVRLYGRQIGIVRPRGAGFEGFMANGGSIGMFNTEFAAAHAVIQQESARHAPGFNGYHRAGVGGQICG